MDSIVSELPIYITGNNTIWKISPDGTVTTLCGSPGERGLRDGKGSDARLDSPCGIAVSPNGSIFFTEWTCNVIRKVTQDGTVSTFYGSLKSQGSRDVLGRASKFCAGIAASPD